jgi:hypothetical protein
MKVHIFLVKTPYDFAAHPMMLPILQNAEVDLYRVSPVYTVELTEYGYVPDVPQ